MEALDYGGTYHEGGTARIWKAYSDERSSMVCLKVAKDEQADALLENEFCVLDKLSELKFVPRVYSLSRVGSRSFGARAMLKEEWLEGASLSAVLQKTSTLPESVVKDLAFVLFEDMAAVHTIGYLHRDLHAGNVFITRQGAVKIIDWGTACHIDDPHDRMPVVNAHPAPEVLSSSAKWTKSADVFELASTLEEAWIGRIHSNSDVPDSAFGAWLRRCTKPYYRDRFHDCGEALKALQLVATKSPAWALRCKLRMAVCR